MPARSTHALVPLASNTELLQRFIRTPLPVLDEHVALILQIGNSHLRRPEPAGREIAEAAEEGDGMAQAGLRLRGEGDVVEELPALRVAAGDERLVLEAMQADLIDEREAAAHRRLTPRLVG